MARKKQKKKGDFQEVQIGPDEPIFTSGVVCRLLGIPIWTLKQLDKENVVRPKRKNANDSRLYSKRQLKKVEDCWYYMKDHKVKIPGLKVILDMKKESL